jgi:murein DD-endopeptidase MepM/ murein hydrolase activator NlpD
VRKRGGSDDKPLLPNLGRVRRARRGSKISRFFRHIFEHKKIKRVLGTNLALLIIASSFFPTKDALPTDSEENIVMAPAVVLTTERPIQYPVVDVKISQGYRLFHPGVDFDGVTGDKVSPVMAGQVEAVGYSRLGYGNAVLINHGGGIASLYAHLSKINVSKGQEVTTRTKLGEMGATGRAYGDHLHLEIRDYGKPVNPLSVLSR